MCSLVISIFLYACESWTLTAEIEKRTQAFEVRCYRRLLNISYKDHVINEEQGGESRGLNNRVHGISCRYSAKTCKKINYISTNTY